VELELELKLEVEDKEELDKELEALDVKVEESDEVVDEAEVANVEDDVAVLETVDDELDKEEVVEVRRERAANAPTAIITIIITTTAIDPVLLIACRIFDLALLYTKS
jgi:hypothetical protein